MRAGRPEHKELMDETGRFLKGKLEAARYMLDLSSERFSDPPTCLRVALDYVIDYLLDEAKQSRQQEGN